MRTYRCLQQALWALLIAYVLAGACQQLVMAGSHRDDVFPADSWALFAKVPGEITDFGVRLLELDGQAVAAPNVVGRAAKAATASRAPLETADAYDAIQKLGRALRNGDGNSVARARRTFERIYLRGAESFRYEVVRRTYDPVERWQDGTIRAAQTLGRFDSRTQP